MDTGSHVYAKLMACLQNCQEMVKQGELPSINTFVEEAISKLSSPMQVAIIGKISSSKSTLVNALLGEAEVVRTGQMEETFNVSWIKYGSEKSDIKVFFKDGTETQVPRSEWNKWSSHQEENRLKTEVRYIEVTYPHETLRSINIIDTPGLDALSEIDSKNTIAFLKEVQPDAVVMLFTKSIAESTMAVLQDFLRVNVGNTFSLTPLNAIGVLAKVDSMWTAMTPDVDVIKEGNRVITQTLYSRYPEVRHSLFDILPISALMGLAASTINQEDMNLLLRLSNTDDALLLEMLSSPNFFRDEDYHVGVTTEERSALYEKFGLYGIYRLLQYIKRHPSVTLSGLSFSLLAFSGLIGFKKLLSSHFGKRAALIKVQGAISKLNLECQAELSRHLDNPDIVARIGKIQKSLISTLLSIHEYKEWHYLNEIYKGEKEYSDSVRKEFLTICGENGAAAYAKLALSANASVPVMIDKATERALYWQKRYNILSLTNPTDAELIKVMLASYNILIKELRDRQQKIQTAHQTIADCNEFLYGRKLL